MSNTSEPSDHYVMRCVRQYYNFLNDRLARRLEEKHGLESRFPSEVLISISKFIADSSGIVVDNGSGFLLAGFAGDDAPLSVFNNSVSTYHVPKDHDGDTNVTFWVGDERPGNLAPRVPRFEYRPVVARGVVSDWEDMERVWRHAFANELRVDPADHPVLLTEPPLNPRANRERMARTMFEAFGVPAVYVANASFLALLSSGRATGCVVNSGYASTHVVPVYEGHVLDHAVISLDYLGGKVLTDYLKRLLCERGISPLGHSQRTEDAIVEDVKQTLCFVSADFEEDMKAAADSSALEKAYEFPNGAVLILGNERFRCPEVLFQPSLLGLECECCIPSAVVDAVEKCGGDPAVREAMYSNVVLSGGNTLFPGFRERLKKEVNVLLALDAPSFQIDDIEEPGSGWDPEKLSWIGGSILASHERFQLCGWITREEFDESGPSVIHRDLSAVFTR